MQARLEQREGDEMITEKSIYPDCGERGTAALTAVLILALLSLFTAATLNKVTTESVMMGNDYSNTKAFYAAQASLELMSRNFNKIFDSELIPSSADLAKIQNTTPNIEGFNFIQAIGQSGAQDTKPIDSGDYAGLISMRTPYKLDTTATYPNGAQVELTRTFFNHQIPIFQFGIFYNDDMEFHPGPLFDFGGRVHSNGNIFMMCGSNLYFRSRVTAAGQIVRDTARNGLPNLPTWPGKVWVADASGTFQEVVRGSVVGGPDTAHNNADMPDGALNAAWASTDSKPFNGNLVAGVRPLKLPIQISSNSDPIQLIKRGKNSNDFEVTALGRTVDDDIMRASRYCNKPGIRISLSDSQSELPGGTGGKRLDGKSDGSSAENDADGSRGYKPPAMADGYQAKRFNGHRLYNTSANIWSGASYTNNGLPANRQTWIKVELVTVDASTLAINAQDITADFLSLGMTHKDPSGLNIGDDRAVLKLQRYEVLGPPIRVAAAEVNTTSTTPTFTSPTDPRSGSSLPVYSYNSSAGTPYSFVALRRSTDSGSNWTLNNWTAANSAASDAERSAQAVTATITQSVTTGSTTVAASSNNRFQVVPFPVEIYNTREGLFNEDLPATGTPSWTSLYTDSTGGKVPVNGVISLIDIDMTNLGKFLRGDWDGKFPANGSLPGGSLSSSDVPDNGGAGYIVYVSDRRGDHDDDGEYDMEDIYINSDGTPNGTLQAGEDVNHDGVLNTDYGWEAERYTVSTPTDLAAVTDHKYFRRGVRLINGDTLIGSTTKGYSIASENAIYILGNYNATGVSAVGTPTPYNQYTGTQVPASVVADAVTILSEAWKDGESFRSPFNLGTRVGTQTTVRAALLMGDTMSSLKVAGVPNGGSGDADLCGGVHNFPRFLEDWNDTLNYCGSMIDLFNSRQHNGAHKDGANTYSPPTRNWVFDGSFLDATRLPPGTPFFQFVQMTGFRQILRQVT
jgi:hypothetical protein